MQIDRSTGNGRIPLRGVIFDYGNVLCHPQPTTDVENMAQVCGMTVPRFREAYWKFRMAYDRSDLNADSYWNSVAGEAGLDFSREQIAKVMELDAKSWSHANKAVVQWVEQLREAGLRLAILSNMPFDISRYLMAQCDWFSYFHHLVFSCDVGRAKPESAIYQSCLQTLDLAADDVLFFDDIAANIASATSLGIHSLLFDTLEQTSARAGERFDIAAPEETREG